MVLCIDVGAYVGWVFQACCHSDTLEFRPPVSRPFVHTCVAYIGTHIVQTYVGTHINAHTYIHTYTYASVDTQPYLYYTIHTYVGTLVHMYV